MTPQAYRAYGLRIVSDIALPELAPERTPGTDDGAAPDLAIRRARLTLSADTRARPTAEDFGPDGSTLWWQSVGGFGLPHDSPDILVDANPGVSDDLIAYPLLGAVLALALHRRGTFAFHASAVAVAGSGVVLVGDKGAGKSTTAASLLAAGHLLIADDIAALDDDAAPRLIPGFGQVKLDAAALDILSDPGSRARVHLRAPMDVVELADKRRVLLPGGLAAAPVPARLICVLDRGPQAGLTQMAAPDALQAVLSHAYVARFGTAALPGAVAARHFRRAAALAASGLVHRLVVPDGVHRLLEAVALIERHLAGGRT